MIEDNLNALERNAEDIRVVMVFGQDTRLGRTLVQHLEAKAFTVVPRSTEHYLSDDNKVADVKQSIELKRPDVVINCLVDPDPGQPPTNWLDKYITLTSAMLQQCRTQGIRYIHCSSAQAFGAHIVPAEPYTEYDPTVCIGSSNTWRPIVSCLESLVWQQTSIYNAAAMASTASGFDCYLLRIGELLSKHSTPPSRTSLISVSESLQMMSKGKQFAVKPTSHQFTISPVMDTTVTEYLSLLCEKSARLPTGTYHLGSSEPVTLAELYTYVGNHTSHTADTANQSKTLPLVGVDGFQGMDTSLLQKRLPKMKLPRWTQAVNSLLSKSIALPM